MADGARDRGRRGPGRSRSGGRPGRAGERGCSCRCGWPGGVWGADASRVGAGVGDGEGTGLGVGDGEGDASGTALESRSFSPFSLPDDSSPAKAKGSVSASPRASAREAGTGSGPVWAWGPGTAASTRRPKAWRPEGRRPRSRRPGRGRSGPAAMAGRPMSSPCPAGLRGVRGGRRGPRPRRPADVDDQAHRVVEVDDVRVLDVPEIQDDADGVGPCSGRCGSSRGGRRRRGSSRSLRFGWRRVPIKSTQSRSGPLIRSCLSCTSLLEVHDDARRGVAAPEAQVEHLGKAGRGRRRERRGLLRCGLLHGRLYLDGPRGVGKRVEVGAGGVAEALPVAAVPGKLEHREQGLLSEAAARDTPTRGSCRR